MTKDLYRLAEKLQRKLRELTGDDPSKVAAVPRVMLDAWATLQKWNLTGEAIVRITEEEEQGLLSHRLPNDLGLALAKLKHESLACQLPNRKEWIVIARHAPGPVEIVVYGPLRWAYKQPLLTYVTELEDGSLAAGFINIVDQPTPVHLSLQPGTLQGKKPKKLSEAEITTEDYRFTLALTKLYK